MSSDNPWWTPRQINTVEELEFFRHAQLEWTSKWARERRVRRHARSKRTRIALLPPDIAIIELDKAIEHMIFAHAQANLDER